MIDLENKGGIDWAPALRPSKSSLLGPPAPRRCGGEARKSADRFLPFFGFFIFQVLRIRTGGGLLRSGCNLLFVFVFFFFAWWHNVTDAQLDGAEGR